MNRAVTVLVVSALSTAATNGCRDATVRAVAGPDEFACAAALAPGRHDTETDHAIVRAQQQARDSARAQQALERLGYLFVARARANNDAGDYALAEMTATCIGSRFPESNAGLLLRGHVLHQLHRFREAEQIARQLVARREVALDYGLLGDALMEQGRLMDATAAYQRMIDLKPFYQSYVRAAHLRWLRGDLEGAIDLMHLAIDSASPRDPESAAWAWTRLAAYALQAGRMKEVTAAVDAALSHRPDYAPALLVRGRAFLATNRPAEALESLRRAAQLNPLPEYQWTLSDALRLAHRDDEALPVERELLSRGAATDPRTLALFLATRHDDAALAVRLTEQELLARQDVFTLDAHAWALAAQGRLDDARRVMTRALAEGTEDGRLFFHAGAIEAAARRPIEARRWLAKAEHLRAMLLPSESAELSRRIGEIRQ
jgi:tetratricopeptide (TPR) repeat protein